MLTVGLALAVLACSGPFAPSPTLDRVSLALGAYDFFVSQPNPPVECGGTGPLSSAGLFARVNLSHEGTEWVARSAAPADGDLEVRFHDTGGAITGSSTISFLPLATTMKGTAREHRYPGETRTFVPDSYLATTAQPSFALSGLTPGGIVMQGTGSILGAFSMTSASGSQSCRLAGIWALTTVAR
ncbi:MAG: hypothetical protein EPO35_06110 [Acidobacteria bacterium]|nr:MAG: hypothetical protein EPO35_06110 [Acidobacteriota bacterium]